MPPLAIGMARSSIHRNGRPRQFVYFTENNACAEVSTNGLITGLASLNTYRGITADNSGNIFVATQTQILKLDKSAGSFSFMQERRSERIHRRRCYSGKISNIRSLATDKNSMIFAMDGTSIRIINTHTDTVKTLTLKVSGTPFALPQGIAADQWDNIYVVNDGNPVGGGPNEGNGTYIRKITPGGTVSNFSGNHAFGRAKTYFTAQGTINVAFDAPNGIILLPSGDFLVSTIDNVIKNNYWHQEVQRQFQPYNHLMLIADPVSGPHWPVRAFFITVMFLRPLVPGIYCWSHKQSKSHGIEYQVY